MPKDKAGHGDSLFIVTLPHFEFPIQIGRQNLGRKILLKNLYCISILKNDCEMADCMSLYWTKSQQDNIQSRS